MAEYEARKDEFPSFVGFVHARNRESERAKQLCKKLGWAD